MRTDMFFAWGLTGIVPNFAARMLLSFMNIKKDFSPSVVPLSISQKEGPRASTSNTLPTKRLPTETDVSIALDVPAC